MQVTWSGDFDFAWKILFSEIFYVWAGKPAKHGLQNNSMWFCSAYELNLFTKMESDLSSDIWLSIFLEINYSSVQISLYLV